MVAGGLVQLFIEVGFHRGVPVLAAELFLAGGCEDGELAFLIGMQAHDGGVERAAAEIIDQNGFIEEDVGDAPNVPLSSGHARRR